jgi:hypothetical protein
MKLLSIIKKSKLNYYITHLIQNLAPKFFYEFQLNPLLEKAKNQPNHQIKNRVDYYVNLPKKAKIDSSFISIKNFKRPKRNSMYFFDLNKVTRYFDITYKIKYKFGDVSENQTGPTFVKSRPINHNGNSVILKLNAYRHYLFIDDKTEFKNKKDLIVWRGVIHKENRRSLVDKFYNHPQCDVGQMGKKNINPKWVKPFLSIPEQLSYKFILSVEGNDVATNLKWIFSSNSLCFSPKLKFETWFMEGKLIANHHFVLIQDDYSDLIEKMNYYTKNIDEALTIIQNANNWVQQFKDKKLEKLISIAVLDAYLKQTKQKI